MARIAVGGFQRETNTFAPHRASWDDFERADAWPGFARGSGLIDAHPRPQSDNPRGRSR
jgi:microcystin degradation protein MlrC